VTLLGATLFSEQTEAATYYWWCLASWESLPRQGGSLPRRVKPSRRC